MTNDYSDRVTAKANLDFDDITVHTTKTDWWPYSSPVNVPSSSIEVTAYLNLKQAKKLHRKLGKAIRTLEAN